MRHFLDLRGLNCGLLRLRHAGIHQSWIGQIVNGNLHAAMHLRFGIHGRHHVHARSGILHLRHIRVNLGLTLRMLEDLRHIDQINHLLAQTGRGHLLQFQRIAHGRHVGDKLTRGLDMELLFGGTCASATRQPCELLTRQIAPLGFAHIGLAIAFHALQHVRGVAAFERLDLAVMYFPHGFAHFIEEPTIVGDEQQCALAFAPTVLQMLGQPVDGHHVQVVGGLVERKNIPILK